MRDVLFLLGPTPKSRGPQQWYESDGGNTRLRQDRKLVAANFPSLRYGLNYRTKLVFLEGGLTLRADCGVPTEILIRLVFPHDYPRTEPIVVDKSGLFLHVPDRHFSADVCCLWLPPESEWKSKDPKALYEFLFHVSVFFERQLIYDADPEKKWPWGERPHYVRGYLEYIAEQLGDERLLQVFSPSLVGGHHIPFAEECPCNSGRRFEACHFKTIEKLSNKVGREILQKVLHASAQQIAASASA